MVQVLYQSQYGSSKQYAEAFAALLDIAPATWDDSFALQTELEAGEGPVVVFSYIHGPRVPGVKAKACACGLFPPCDPRLCVAPMMRARG